MEKTKKPAAYKRVETTIDLRKVDVNPSMPEFTAHYDFRTYDNGQKLAVMTIVLDGYEATPVEIFGAENIVRFLQQMGDTPPANLTSWIDDDEMDIKGMRIHQNLPEGIKNDFLQFLEKVFGIHAI